MIGFFFFNDTATTEIYTLSLHDALPIYIRAALTQLDAGIGVGGELRDVLVLAVHRDAAERGPVHHRSEEHTSELQSLAYLVCRLLLEKKKEDFAGGTAPDHVRGADVTTN